MAKKQKKRESSPNDDDYDRIAEYLHTRHSNSIKDRKTFNDFYKSYMDESSNPDFKRVKMRENVFQTYARNYPGKVNVNEPTKGYDKSGREREASIQQIKYKRGPSYRLRDLITGIFLSMEKPKRKK